MPRSTQKNSGDNADVGDATLPPPPPPDGVSTPSFATTDQFDAFRSHLVALADQHRIETDIHAQARADLMQQQLDKLIAAVTIAPAPSAPPPEVATAPAASPPTDTLPVVSPPAPLGGVPPRAHLEPAAELPTIDEGNAEADDAAELELEEMLEQLSVDPASSVNFADAFGGHPLPVPLFEGDADHQPNPYPRTPSFRNRTSHYAPAAWLAMVCMASFANAWSRWGMVVSSTRMRLDLWSRAARIATTCASSCAL